MTAKRWHEGRLWIPERDGELAGYCVKTEPAASSLGIDNGRISGMTIRIDGKIVCNYEEGWNIKPETKEAKHLYSLLIQKYN